jgi:hypothetical protein
MLLNDVKLQGVVDEIEEKTYPDGCVITYFKLLYDRVSRTDVFTCRVFVRNKDGKSAFMDSVKNGDTVQISGILTTSGSNQRACVDVHWWNVWPKPVTSGEV